MSFPPPVVAPSKSRRETPILITIALFLTTWHMAFSTAMTQILARFTNILDSRHKVPMTPQTYA